VAGVFSSKRYCVDCKRREESKTAQTSDSKVSTNSLEEAIADLKISDEEVKNNRQSIVDVVNTFTSGIKRLPRAESVFFM
jgi:transposase